MIPAPPPLILTLKLDGQTFAILQRLRQQYFPARRNFVEAHVTLFHALPGSEKDPIEHALWAVCTQTPPISLSLPGPRLLRRGVALAIDGPALKSLREKLAAGWEPWLGPQDRQAYRPHVTIQNKVTPEKARHLFEQITRSWKPLEATGEGLQLWRYLGGPWELLMACAFRKGGQ